MYTKPFIKTMEETPSVPLWDGAARHEFLLPAHKSLPRHEALVHCLLKAGQSSPLQCHQHAYEVAFVLAGRGVLSLTNGPSLAYQAGDVLYVPEGTAYTIAAAPEGDVSFFFFRARSETPPVGTESKKTEAMLVRLSLMPLEDVHDGAGRRHHVLATKKDPVNPQLYAVAHTYIDAGQCFDWHKHKGIYEIGIVRAGQGTLTFENGPRFDFKAGDVMYIPPETVHRIDVTGNKTGEFFFIRNFLANVMKVG